MKIQDRETNLYSVCFIRTMQGSSLSSSRKTALAWGEGERREVGDSYRAEKGTSGVEDSI